MARVATTNLLQEAATRFGTEPITVIKIEWEDVTAYYGDKTLTIGNVDIIGSILDFSTLSSQVKSDGAGDFSSANVTLDDSEGDLKLKLNTQLLEGRAATVYQYFQGLGIDDLMVLLKGRISGDIQWSEGERTLSFDIEHYIEDNEIGFAPDETDIPDLSEDAIEQPWPLCFGTVLKVPAVHILRPPNGELRETWKNTQLFGLETLIRIERGEDFPQDTVIDILVGNIRVRGTMDKDTFTVSEANLAVYTNVSISDRPSSDVHSQDARVLWIEDQDINLVGQYCYLQYNRDGDEFLIVNYCISQYGNKCYFKKPWQIIITYPQPGVGFDATYDGLNVLIDSNNSPIIETAGIPRESWADTYWSPTGGIYEPGGPNSTAFPKLDTFPAWQRFGVLRDKWLCKPGTFVRQLTGYNDLYVANLIPSTSILEVYAKRTYRGEEIFVPIPSRYYIKHFRYSIAGQTSTVIEFRKSLLSYVGENWDEEIYVSLRSTVGPNVSNIIKWLIQTYSNLEIDSTSFESVRLLVDKFWANFALFKQDNVLSICEDIARQARCAILIGNGQIKIRYLSQIPVSLETINEDLVELKSINLGFTPFDDVVTKTKNEWLLDYSGREEYEKNYTYKNNINSLGLIEEEEDYFIYNIELFVKISAGFWGYRKSNIWRLAQFTSFINLINVEAFDALTLNLAIVSTNQILSDITTQNHESDFAPNVSLELTMGSKSGESDDNNQPIQDDNYWLGDPNYPANMTIPSDLDPGAGRSEVDYIVPTDLEGNSGGEDDEEQENENIIVFRTIPDTVFRTQPFSVVMQIIDKNGRIVNKDQTAQLELRSDDENDLIGSGAPGTGKSISIQFSSGIYTADNLYITGGTEEDVGLFIVTAANFDEVRSDTFDIRDVPTQNLVIDIFPSVVTRGNAFTVKVSGGNPGQSIDAEFATTDNRDGIYVNGVKLPINGRRFIIVLDGSGEYNSTVWSIRGGFIDGAQGYFKVSDPDKILGSAIKSPITVNGDSPAVFEGDESQIINVAQTLQVKSTGVVIEHTGTAGIDRTFSLTIKIVDAEDNVVTDFNGTAVVTVLDANDVTIEWLDAGPNANNYTTEINADIVNGIWTYDAVLWDILETDVSPATVIAAVNLGDGSVVAAEHEVPIGLDNFEVTAPVEVTRGVAFALGVQAMLGDGTYDTAYVPTTPLNIILTSSDAGDSILPITIPTTGWVNGFRSINVTISGGLGSDTGNIEVEDTVTGLKGNQDIAIDPVVLVKPNNEIKIYDGFGSYIATFIGPDPEDWSPLDCEPQAVSEFLTTQSTALDDFRSDAILGNAFGNPHMYREVDDLHDYARFACRYRLGYFRFLVTAGDRAGAQFASIRGKIYQRQAYDNPTRLFRASPFAGSYILKIGATYAVDYTSGLQVEGMSEPEEYTFSYINQLQTQAGWDGQGYFTAQDIDIPIPVEWLDNMTGNFLYIWFFIQGTTPYNCTLYRNETVPERAGGEDHGVDSISLRIQK